MNSDSRLSRFEGLIPIIACACVHACVCSCLCVCVCTHHVCCLQLPSNQSFNKQITGHGMSRVA